VKKTIITILLVLLLSFNFASAVVINSVQAETLEPGTEGQISIEVKNILDEDVEDVCFLYFGIQIMW